MLIIMLYIHVCINLCTAHYNGITTFGTLLSIHCHCQSSEFCLGCHSGPFLKVLCTNTFKIRLGCPVYSKITTWYKSGFYSFKYWCSLFLSGFDEDELNSCYIDIIVVLCQEGVGWNLVHICVCLDMFPWWFNPTRLIVCQVVGGPVRPTSIIN